jgi:uncharacterized membrane protein YdbT with pleckstrin-like domain
MIGSPEYENMAADKPRSVANLLFITIADTTWRAFVPTIGGTFVGIWFDHSFNTAPLWTTIMICVGFITSISLVVMQLRGLKKK